ncbi:RNA recognition motif domain-containing protein [Candidatus Dependentiae bacterium]
MNIYVGNIAHSVSEDVLRSLFEQFGQIVSVKIITDKFTGLPRGFAFVQMATKEEALKAIEELNGHELEGRSIVVNEARERKPRRDFGGNGGGGGRGGNGGGGRGRY